MNSTWPFKISVSRSEFTQILISDILDHCKACFRGSTYYDILTMVAVRKGSKLTPAEKEELKKFIQELENESRLYKHTTRYDGELYQPCVHK